MDLQYNPGLVTLLLLVRGGGETWPLQLLSTLTQACGGVFEEEFDLSTQEEFQDLVNF